MAKSLKSKSTNATTPAVKAVNKSKLVAEYSQHIASCGSILDALEKVSHVSVETLSRLSKAKLAHDKRFARFMADAHEERVRP